MKKAAIYTRTGDNGQTSLFAGGRTSKGSARLQAYGTIDELNSVLGLALAHGLVDELVPTLTMIQNELFTVGADLATPLDAEAPWVIRVEEDQIARLEREIDQMDEHLEVLKNFILPGGTMGAATLHVARTVCRRAERWIVVLSEEERINLSVIGYVNRLSDWLFTAARFENMQHNHPDPVWKSPRQQG